MREAKEKDGGDVYRDECASSGEEPRESRIEREEKRKARRDAETEKGRGGVDVKRLRTEETRVRDFKQEVEEEKKEARKSV